MICHVERVYPSSRSSLRALEQFRPTCDGAEEVYEIRGWTQSWGREGNRRETERSTTYLKNGHKIIYLNEFLVMNLINF